MSHDLTTTILRKAAEKLQPEGAWMRVQFGRLKNGQAPGRLRDAILARDQLVSMCVRTAIAIAAYEVAGNKEALRVGHEASERFRSFLELGDETLPAWNDAPERTQAQVIEQLLAAASR